MRIIIKYELRDDRERRLFSFCHTRDVGYPVSEAIAFDLRLILSACGWN